MPLNVTLNSQLIPNAFHLGNQMLEDKMEYLKHYFRIALGDIVGGNIPYNSIHIRPAMFTSRANNVTGAHFPNGVNNINTNVFYFGKIYGSVDLVQTFKVRLWNKDDTLFNTVMRVSGLADTGYTGFNVIPFEYSDVLFNYITMLESSDSDNNYLAFMGWEIELRDVSLSSSEV